MKSLGTKRTAREAFALCLVARVIDASYMVSRPVHDCSFYECVYAYIYSVSSVDSMDIMQ